MRDRGCALGFSGLTLRIDGVTSEHMQRAISNWVVGMCLVGLTACTSQNHAEQPTAGGGAVLAQSQGYSLLYKLMSDESDVSKILWIKSVSDGTKGLVKEIANASQDAKKQLEGFAKKDKSLQLDVPGLPAMEQRSRDLQAKEDENGLLGSKGEAFERHLLFTQAEATNYATQLARALLEKETNPERRAFLDEQAKKFADIHARTMNRLAVK